MPIAWPFFPCKLAGNRNHLSTQNSLSVNCWSSIWKWNNKVTAKWMLQCLWAVEYMHRTAHKCIATSTAMFVENNGKVHSCTRCSQLSANDSLPVCTFHQRWWSMTSCAIINIQTLLYYERQIKTMTACNLMSCDKYIVHSQPSYCLTIHYHPASRRVDCELCLDAFITLHQIVGWYLHIKSWPIFLAKAHWIETRSSEYFPLEVYLGFKAVDTIGYTQKNY